MEVWFPGMWILFPLYLLAILLFISFRNQRTFPIVLIPAVFAVNAVEIIRELTRGLFYLSIKYVINTVTFYKFYK